MVLQGQPCGRVGRCRVFYFTRDFKKARIRIPEGTPIRAFLFLRKNPSRDGRLRFLRRLSPEVLFEPENRLAVHLFGVLDETMTAGFEEYQTKRMAGLLEAQRHFQSALGHAALIIAALKQQNGRRFAELLRPIAGGPGLYSGVLVPGVAGHAPLEQ
jgi:hypothetical protein